MWIKKDRKDRDIGRYCPIPTQVVSNEEYIPMPQTADQRKVERRIEELANAYAQSLNVDRRQFLASTGGMAAAAGTLAKE